MKHFLMIVACLSAALVVVSCATTSGSDSATEQTWVFPASETDSVDIKLYSTDVEVRLWDNQDICVVAESSDGRLPSCYIRGSTLLCKTEKSAEGHGSKIYMFIPESFFAEEWKISTESGYVNASQIWGSSCEIKTISGRITLSKCEVQELDLTSVSGRIQADDLICSGTGEFSSTSGRVQVSGFVGETDVSTVSGAVDFDLAYPFVGDSCISTLSGAIRLTMPENSGFKLKYDTLSGSVRDDFTSFHGKGSGTSVYKDGGIELEMETLSGSVSIIRRK